MKYYLKKQPPIDYLVLIQPHASGQVHFHLLIKTMNGSRINPNVQKLKTLWKFGNSEIKDIHHIRNLAAYMSNEMLNDDIDENDPDKPAKYARINYYPIGMKIYRSSNNLKKPTKKVMSHPKLNSLIKGEDPTFISKTSSKYEGNTYNHMHATWESIVLKS